MILKNDAPFAAGRGERLCFWAILAVAAALRLWRLEVPSLWFDEILVAMVAKSPVWSIFQRTLSEDFHPPSFYLMTKLVMSIGSSDSVLRLPQLLFGLAGVWFARKAGREMLGAGGGLLLAALVATQPWHLVLSRQLRPYSIIFVFSLMSFFFLWRGMKRGQSRDFLYSGLCLWPPLMLHFSGLLAVGGAGLTMLCGLAAGRVKPRGALAFCLSSGLAVACVLPFLFSLFSRETGVTGGHTYISVIGATWDRLSELMNRELYPELRAALAVLSVLGFIRLARRDRLLALVSSGWLLFPLLALVAVRYSTYFNPWHLTFLLGPILLWQAQALLMLGRERAAPLLAVALALLGGWWYSGPNRSHYYGPASYSGDYKARAAAILGAHSPDMAFVYPQSSDSGPLNWYLDLYADPNPVRSNRLEPELPRVKMLIQSEMGSPRFITRTPVTVVDRLPFQARVTFAPEDFLAHVYRAEYVACEPVLEKILIATQAGKAGVAQFRYENRTEAPQTITVFFGFYNRKPDNRLVVSCRFDDEPWTTAFHSQGPDLNGDAKIILNRDKPYHTFDLRYELFRDGRSWAFTGEDLDAVRLVDFKVRIESEKK